MSIMASLSHQLSFLSRHRLAQILDQDNIRGCDWRALVEQMGFTYEMILFLRDKKSPTMALLEEWEMKEGSGANINVLIEMVEVVDNVPALEVLKDVKVKLSARPLPISPRLSPTFSTSPQQSPLSSLRQQENIHDMSRRLSNSCGSNPPVKASFGQEIDPNNLSSDLPSYSQINDLKSNDSLKQIHQKLEEESLTDHLSMLSVSSTSSVTKDDDRRGSGCSSCSYFDDDNILKGRSLSDMDRSLFEGTEFDVFLSFALADSDFAEEMRLRFEHRAGISCYLPSEGLMPGQSFQEEIADKIKRGCRKTVIIMSPHYIDSPWCTYEARLAHHKNPDPRRHVLIPVVYEKCDVPDFISYLYYLDYPRYKSDPNKCERYFWERLYKAVKLPQR